MWFGVCASIGFTFILDGKPKIDVIVLEDLPVENYENKEMYMRDVVRINAAATRIRLAHIQARKYTESTKK